MTTETKVMKETKNKIRVDFERTSAWERFKLKVFSASFIGNAVWYIFRFVLLLGISFVILRPFFTKIASSFMSAEDLVDATVKLIPKYPTLDRYASYVISGSYLKALLDTLILALIIAVVQTFMCCFIGYGFAKYKFKGVGILFGLVVLTMVVPHNAIKFAMHMRFCYFDVFGIVEALTGRAWNLLNTFWPFALLSLTGLAFKNGLYIFMMRQFFRGVPDELEESAYIDGSGVFRTFFTIILPLSVPMMITIFLFAFSWQWTDYFYTDLFFPTGKIVFLSNFTNTGKVAEAGAAGSANSATASMLIIAPLIVMYLFCQRYLIQGIERSGIVG